MDDCGFVCQVVKGESVVQLRSEYVNIQKKIAHLNSIEASLFASEQARQHLGFRRPGVRARRLKQCKTGTFDVITDAANTLKYQLGDIEPMLEIEYTDI